MDATHPCPGFHHHHHHLGFSLIRNVLPPPLYLVQPPPSITSPASGCSLCADFGLRPRFRRWVDFASARWENDRTFSHSVPPCFQFYPTATGTAHPPHRSVCGSSRGDVAPSSWCSLSSAFLLFLSLSLLCLPLPLPLLFGRVHTGTSHTFSSWPLPSCRHRPIMCRFPFGSCCLRELPVQIVFMMLCI